MRIFLYLVLIVPLPLLAQDAQLDPVPATVNPGTPFALVVNGTFSSPCVLAADSVTATLDTSGAQPSLTIDLLQRDDIACPAVVVRDRQAYGPFELDLAQSVGVTVDVEFRSGASGQTPQVIASTQITLTDAVTPAALIQPGVYWDPDFAGHGVAVERQGMQVFAVLFSYLGNGNGAWLTGEGSPEELKGLNRFAGGGCLICGDRVALNTPQIVETQPGFFVATARHEALLTPGEGPARMLMLRPFTQTMANSEGTIAGETFPLPDWTGEWLFAFLEDSELTRTVLLSQVFSGISDSGQAVFESDAGDVRITCSERMVNVVSCALAVDGVELAIAPLAEQSHNQMFFESVVGIRLD